MTDSDQNCKVIDLQNDPDAQFSIRWANVNGAVGMLTWHDGELKFRGNADESAREFLKYLSQHSGLKLVTQPVESPDTLHSETNA